MTVQGQLKLKQYTATGSHEEVLGYTNQNLLLQTQDAQTKATTLKSFGQAVNALTNYTLDDVTVSYTDVGLQDIIDG